MLQQSKLDKQSKQLHNTVMSNPNPEVWNRGELSHLTWNQHYNDPLGSEKVEQRRAVYDCLRPGEHPVNFERELRAAAVHAGLDAGASIVDVGCSFPWFLLSWQGSGHTGRLVGIEPNTAQFNGLPYWEPKDGQHDPKSLLDGMPPDALELFFSQIEVENDALPGIHLFKSDANFIPATSGSVDLLSFMFSFYHVRKDRQLPAIIEARRVLRKDTSRQDALGRVSGMFALATSGNQNKRGIRENEIRIAAMLSELYGEEVTPPEPLNSGFTTEDARTVLPPSFRYVYEYLHETEMFIDSDDDVAVVIKAYKTLRDKYRKTSGEFPDKLTFSLVLRECVELEMFERIDKGSETVDHISQSLFLASDRELDLPDKYKELTK
jgi:hypothetical protein